MYFFKCLGVTLCLPLLLARPLLAQSSAATVPASNETSSVITVTAEKLPGAIEDVPLSITAVTSEQIKNANITEINQAAPYVPNLFLEQFTNRRLSFPFIRGIGSGRNNPAITTCIDGVPQLSFATSNLEFVDVDRIEFLRGPQGSLYGRNTLGGVINIVSRRPSNVWTFSNTDTFGNYALQDYRSTVSGPIVSNQLYFSLGGGYMSRDGYTTNDFTGHDLDFRRGEFGHGQILWTPSHDLEITFSILAETDHDGDYALGELNSIRQNPHHVSHDFEGYSTRNVAEPSLTLRYTGNKKVEFTSISAYQNWNSHDLADLDTTALDLIRRNNQERQGAFTEELRLNSPVDRPAAISKDLKLHWLAGAFLFTSQYSQDACNQYSSNGAAMVGIPVPFQQFNTANLDDVGLGIFGHGTLCFFDKLDLTLGLRYDYEQKDANLSNFTSPSLSPASQTSASNNFDKLTGRIALAYHWTSNFMTYVSIAQGYKAGGFNSASPPNKVAYGPEDSLTYELGVKKTWLNNRLMVNADFFYVDWSNMQLDVPLLSTPGEFYIDNVAQSFSRGFELEASARPIDGWEVFGGVGITDAHFTGSSSSMGTNINGNTLPLAPAFTYNVGTQYSFKIQHNLRVYARADVHGVGKYFYDASNDQAQSAYCLTSFRLGIGAEHWRVEGWITNAFDQNYVPVAFPFGSNHYVGEAGAPQTYGVTLRIEF